jgi:hypothetical protein
MPDERLSPLRRLSSVLAVLVAPILVLAVAAPAAHAAVPDAVGFALYNPVSVTLPDAWPTGTAVSAVATGHYAVRFPGIASRGGVVHVTAVNSRPHWCQAEKWTASGADEIVYLACYATGGVPDASGFSVLYTSSTGPLPPSPTQTVSRYGYVDAKATGALVSQYNSAGGVNGVTHTGTGTWTVKMPGLGTPGPRAGGLQATAVNAELAAFCKVVNWLAAGADQQVAVACFNRGGGPLDTEFTLSYQYQRSLYGGAYPPKYFGYLANVPSMTPTSGPTNFNSVSGTASNLLVTAGLGQWEAIFPDLAPRPDNVQVTSAGVSVSFCDLTAPWQISGTDTVVKTVGCYTVNGAPVSSDFLVSDNSIY